MIKKPVVFDSPEKMYAHSLAARKKGQSIGLVPTMGALHEGHLSLMEYTREKCDLLVTSIFVNPLQFDKDDDLAKYPRTFERDLTLCAEKGVDAVFAPTPDTMYPKGFETAVNVEHMTKGLCGAGRKGHFQGVTTVVLKLFNTVQCDLASFGQKDYQQLKVIQRMVKDLGLGLKVQGLPTVREKDGLAMSSRNKHLSSLERENALCLYRAMSEAQKLADQGETKVDELLLAAEKIIKQTPGASKEYIEIVDSESLEPIKTLDRPARICLAVWLGNTRLIDNNQLN